MYYTQSCVWLQVALYVILRIAYTASMKTTYGKRLKKLREEAGMSQADFAKKAGVSKDNIQNHEQDRSAMSADTLFVYCKALGIDCSAFAGCIVKQRPAK